MPLEAEVLAAFPAEVQIPARLVAGGLDASSETSPRVFVVLDDDPTGTQSVADLPVLTRWEVADFTWAFAHEINGRRQRAVYVLTNTRSLDPAEAAARNEEIVRNALAAAAVPDSAGSRLRLSFVSRSDSTLRGHFPLEPDVIAATVAAVSGEATDGVVIVPAFPDAGRVTIGGVHYMRGTGDEAGRLTPVAETEFARDASFGFANSELAKYVEEKSRGRFAADSVIVLDLNIIRAAGPDGDPAVSAKAIADALDSATDSTPIVADIVTENDLRALALGLEEAERRGKKLLYRAGPPFLRARIGQEIRAELSGEEAYAGQMPSQAGGLIVVGSHVGVTTRQLKALTEQHRAARTVEIDVEKLLGGNADGHLEQTVDAVVEALRGGDVIVHTSRLLIKTGNAAESLRIARTVSAAVVAVVNRTLKTFPPRFVIAKGGITSSDVAAHGLEIRHAIVRGPMLPGIVSLWEPVDGPAKGIPYIVFAGNVGDDQSLAQVTRKLSNTFQPAQHTYSPEKTMTANYKVTVLGLGAMGLPMATRLATQLTVHGFDIAEPRLKLAEGAGVRTFGSAREAAQDTDALLLAVRNGEQLNDVLFGENGVASVLKPGAVVILTSTVGTEAIPATVARLAEHGVALVDAPLSGGPKRAGEGDLLIVVGAEPGALETARPVLELLASTLTVVGDKPGDGQALKTVNQLLCGVHIAAAAEAMALADALGLDQAKTLAALEAGAAGSFMLSNRGPRILEAYTEDGAEVLSRLDIFVKDMGIVGKATRAAGLAAPVAAAAEQLYLLGQAQGLAAADDSAVIKVVAPSRRTV